jgi:hypothetical protein
VSERDAPPRTVAEISALYLGNILYALEVTAMTLEQQDPAQGREQASFYRGIARVLAEARGREKQEGADR